jgi:hypothetical protein
VTDQTKYDALAALFREAGQAHHHAYRATDGADADWPIWYAEHLHEPLAALLGASFTKSELVYLLVTLDRDLKARAPGAEWVGFYTRWFLERYG